jgi:hypothetical protein
MDYPKMFKYLQIVFYSQFIFADIAIPTKHNLSEMAVGKWLLLE